MLRFYRQHPGRKSSWPWGGSGALGKYYFMTAQGGDLLSLRFTSNDPLSDLVFNLKLALSKRYQNGSNPTTSLPSFVSREVYKSLPFTHDTMIRLFDDPLNAENWPVNEKIVNRRMASNLSAAFIMSSSKRSRSCLGASANSNSVTKRLNLGSGM